jgi:hypothetical protein
MISFGQENKHIGKWNSKDKYGNIESIILDKNNFVIFIEKDKTYRGENFQIKGKNHMYKYEINYSKNPIQIDFIVYEKETNMEKYRIKSIIRFVDENKIELRNSMTHSNLEYPTSFSGKEDKYTKFFERNKL